MTKPLTDSQTLVLNFIKNFRQESGNSPSYRDIQKYFRYKSVKAAQDHVQALIQKGVLEKPAKRHARNLLPTGERLENAMNIPIYGEIAAGSPRDNAQLELGSLVVSKSLSKKKCFALKVVGNSMIEVGILEGDVVIVEKCDRPRNGEIIVALLDKETTVKTYREKNGQAFLIPENREMKPIPLTGKKLEVQGRVIGLQRHY
jgi:repressor LexA